MDRNIAELNTQELFTKAANELAGLELVIPFTVVIEGAPIVAPVLIKNFGAPMGTVLFVTGESRKSGDFRDATRLLKVLGYTVSIISGNISPQRNPYDRNGFIETLRDWGWTGDETQKPQWL